MRALVCTLGLIGLACSSTPTPAGSGGGGAGGGGAGGGGAGAGGGGAGGTAGSAANPFVWSPGRACPMARFEANGAVIGGELWVLGGFNSASLEVTRQVDIYDPETDSWRRGPDLPGAETHMAVVAIGGDIIVAGGLVGAFSSPLVTTAAVWRYRATTATWTAGPGMPTAGAGFFWALLGTELHVAGGLGPDGNSDASVHYAWDIAGAGAATWTTAASVPYPRNHGGSAAAGGLFYAIAGRNNWDEVAGNVAHVHAFDAMTGTWTTRAPIPLARSEIGASTSTLADGRILVVGGSTAGIVPSADVSVYDPTANVWSTLAPLPEPRKGAVALQVGRRIIVTTGSPTSIDPSATTFVGCCLQ